MGVGVESERGRDIEGRKEKIKRSSDVCFAWEICEIFTGW